MTDPYRTPGDTTVEIKRSTLKHIQHILNEVAKTHSSYPITWGNVRQLQEDIELLMYPNDEAVPEGPITQTLKEILRRMNDSYREQLQLNRQLTNLSALDRRAFLSEVEKIAPRQHTGRGDCMCWSCEFDGDV